MRIFLIRTNNGLFPSTGEYRANASLLKYLHHRGHVTGELCFADEDEITNHLAERKREEGIDVPVETETVVFAHNKSNSSVDEIPVRIFTDPHGTMRIAISNVTFKNIFTANSLAEETAEYIEKGTLSINLHELLNYITSKITVFQPTHLIFSDSLSLKATANMVGMLDIRRIFIAHTAEQLPFGPFAGGLVGSACSPLELELLRNVDGVWTVSKTLQEYAKKHGGLDTTHLNLHPWTFLHREQPRHWHNWDNDAIGMINPTSFKGAAILQELAKKLPQFKFVAWKSWGMEKDTEEALRELPNIELRESCSDVDDVWAAIKILIVPSLWHEAWGMVVTEAQLRGIPVISSNAGAIPEAKLGLPYIVPVNALTGERYERGKYVVPPQDVEPWIGPVVSLMTNKEEYERLSERIRQETIRWISTIDEDAHEKWFESMLTK